MLMTPVVLEIAHVPLDRRRGGGEGGGDEGLRFNGAGNGEDTGY